MEWKTKAGIFKKPVTWAIPIMLVAVLLVTGVLNSSRIVDTVTDAAKSVFTIGTETAYAAGTPDYTCDGVADDVEIQAAVNALPADGGRICILAGTYNFTATVTRAIDDVIIEGVGAGVVLNNNGAAALFSAGAQDGWSFRDLETDAGGITVASATTCSFENVTIGTDYYAYWTSEDITGDEFNIPTGRSVYYVVASSDASDWEIAQADYVCDGTADDVEIQDALDNLPASGGMVQLVGQTFHISATIDMGSRSGIIGKSSYPLLYIDNGSDCDLFDLTEVYGCYIGYISINGNKANNAAGDGIHISNPTVTEPMHRFEQIYMREMDEDGVYIGAGEADICTFNEVSIRSCDGHGYYIGSGGQMLIGCDSGGNGLSGLYITDTGCQIIGQQTWGNGALDTPNDRSGMYITGSSNRFTNCLIDYNNKHGIFISGDYNIFYNNVCRYNGQTNTGAGVALYGGEHNIIIGNQIYDDGLGAGGAAQDYGILEYNGVGSADNIVIDNTLYGNISAQAWQYGDNSIWRNNKGYTASGDTVTVALYIDHGDITDGGGLTGYIDLTENIPTRCKVLSVNRDLIQAFKDTVGANSFCKVQVGENGTPDNDRWDHTAAPGDDIWNSTTDAAWDFSTFQGTVVTSAARTPRITFTVDGDMTDLISGAGAQGTMMLYVTYRVL